MNTRPGSSTSGARARRVFSAALPAFLVLAALSRPAAAAKASAAGGTQEVAVLSTPYGEIAWRFLPDAAPQHVAYVKELIRRGFYDGTTFHRVIPHFVAQGGDPNSKNADRADDGEGEADRRVPAEFSTTLHYRPGTVGMARDVDPGSGSCQFFIALESLPRLDTRYTIFGEVISGLEVARAIAERPRDTNDNPLERIAVTARLAKRRVPAAALSAILTPRGSGLRDRRSTPRASRDGFPPRRRRSIPRCPSRPRPAPRARSARRSPAG